MTSLPRPSKIVCVGRNYVKHAEELGNTVPEKPLLFLKPPSAIVGDGEPIERPEASQKVEHEGEIGVVIGRRCRDVAEADALSYVAGYSALNDVTARDLQRADGQWSRAKGFDTFCPIGGLAPATDGGELVDPAELEVRCSVDGELRQHGRASDMAFPVPYLIAYISGIMTLEPGDVIATGTPEGVGELPAGSEVVVEVLWRDRVVSSVGNAVVRR